MKICGDGVKVTQSLFQTKEGGAIPTSPLQCKVFKCDFKDIRFIFEKYHYKKGHIGGGISFCLSLVFNEQIVGGAVIGKPRHENKYKNCVEIRRMALIDECPKNSESYFLGKIIWYIKKNKIADKILSYSDMSVGHKGTIYKASNFKEIGETSPTLHIFWNGIRYHPRSLTIERPYSYKLREAVKNGEAKKEIGLPKKIFMYELKK
jgi:hypothetical protein